MHSDVFDALSGTNASVAEFNPIEIDLKGTKADLPDASHPLISSVTNAGTEEQHNGTSAEALDEIKKLLKPPRVMGGGYKASGLDDLLRERLLEIKQFLWVYIDPNSQSHRKWTMSSTAVVKSLKKKPWHARVIRGHVRAFIKDHDDLPYHNYGTWNETILEKDKAFAQGFYVHLQLVSEYV